MCARGLWREVNDFFSSTSIFGFSYITDTQTRSTRIIWTFIIFGGFAVTSYFLFETFHGFGEKYVTTTIQTKSIEDYPFPAVTFHPGDHNSKDAYLRYFLNEFEFSRYDKKSKLRDNEQFMMLYEWLISPMNDQLFDDIEKLLIGDTIIYLKGKTYLQYKAQPFRDEVCALVAIQSKNISLRSGIRYVFMSNMFKFRNNKERDNVILNHVGEMINKTVAQQNLTKKDITESCNDQNNEEILTEMQALIVSFVYFTFHKMEVLAGDLATGPYAPPLSRATHTLLTSIYNDMVSVSLPVSVLQFPQLFTKPDKYFPWLNNGLPDLYFPSVPGSMDIIELDGITVEAWRNYHYLWYTYYHEKQNFTLFCMLENCTAKPLEFVLSENSFTDKLIVEQIRKNLEEEKLVEGVSTSPPCSNSATIDKFKLKAICSFQTNMSNNKETFLELMKFTKQSPVFLEDKVEEYSSFPTKYGYTKKKSFKDFFSKNKYSSRVGRESKSLL